MARDRTQDLLENWNHLRVRILLDHKSKQPQEVILKTIDKEFLALGRQLLNLQVFKRSYSILKVDLSNITRGHITVGSSNGMHVNIYEQDWKLFADWTKHPPERKLVCRRVGVNLDGKGYTINKVYPEEPKVEQHWEAHDRMQKLLDGDAGDFD